MKTALTFLLFSAVNLLAVEPTETIALWPGDAPGEVKGEVGEEGAKPNRPGSKKIIRLGNVTKPTIALFPAPKAKANGAAVVVCPGGGYSILAYDLEGTEVCEWLNSIGMTGILLKYRVPRRKNREKHAAPLQDAQRAMGIARSKAKAWGIDPKRIGILGFSAGGHLTASTLTNYDKRTYERVDAADDLSCRPDFGVLIYPAYLVDNGTKSKLEPEIRVTKDTPPCFFAHAGDDRIPAEGSVQMYLALRRAGVKGNELHVYPKGGHGYGLRASDHPVVTWPARAGEWMKAMGWLKR
ncbi:MAG: xylanase [Opitutales bacterium]|nr:xylanase [Opitutales bacterium]